MDVMPKRSTLASPRDREVPAQQVNQQTGELDVYIRAFAQPLAQRCDRGRRCEVFEEDIVEHVTFTPRFLFRGAPRRPYEIPSAVRPNVWPSWR